MFKMNYWDKEFSTRQMKNSNPLKDMVMVNGLILPASALPLDVQEELRRKGIIDGD